MTQNEVQQLRSEVAKVNDTLLKYIEADEAWKVRAEPVVKAFENTSWLFRIAIAVLKFVGLLIPMGAIALTLKKFLLQQ